MAEPGLDLSRKFRQAYGFALSGGIALTVLSSLSIAKDIDRLRDHVEPGGDPTLDAMTSGAYFRAGVTIALLLLLWRFVLRPMADQLAGERRRLQEAEAAQRAVSARQALTAQIHDALDMVDDEADVHRVVERAIAQIAPEHPAELLLADSSRAHLQRAAANPTAGAPGCGVASPNSCPAARRGRTTIFTSSTDLSACPHLADRPQGACSAACIPVNAMGRNLGVLHIVGADGTPPDADRVESLSIVAAQVGVRIGNLRSMARAQLQASTDGLTGLANRRATVELVAQMLRREPVVALAMVDLDRFKQLNDTYGHEAGDRALRAFADVARKSLRDDDIIGRWGGEEFVVAMPRTDRDGAAAVLDRLRMALLEASERAELPPVTASMGVVDSGLATDIDELVRLADEALLAAKAQGRDRVVIGPVVVEPSGPGVPSPAA